MKALLRAGPVAHVSQLTKRGFSLVQVRMVQCEQVKPPSKFFLET